MNPYLKLCVPYIRKPVVNFSWLHVHPYNWDESTNHPSMTTSRWVKAHWLLNCGLYLAYVAFLVWHTVVIGQDPAESPTKKVYIAFSAQFYMPGAILYITMLTISNDWTPFVRRCISFLKNCEK